MEVTDPTNCFDQYVTVGTVGEWWYEIFGSDQNFNESRVRLFLIGCWQPSIATRVSKRLNLLQPGQIASVREVAMRLRE